MAKANKLRRFLRGIGLLATVAACGYVAYSLYQTGALSISLWSQPKYWVTIFLLSALYGALLAFIAWGWLIQVNAASNTKLPFLRGLHIYSVSQIYKYLPSNVLHYLGRHAMLREQNIGHGAAIWGTAAETALIIVGAASVSSVFGLTHFRELMPADFGFGQPVLIFLIFTLIVGVAVFSMRDRIREFAKPELAIAGLKTIPLYFLFFVVSGWAFWVLAYQLEGVLPEKIPEFIVISSSAWVLGYITPGVSAGIGIRETLIIAGLSVVGHQSDAAVMAISYRLVTTFGDVFFFGCGWLISLAWIKRKKTETQ